MNHISGVITENKICYRICIFSLAIKKYIYELSLPIREGIITEIINIFNECEQTMRKAMLVMPEKICNYLYCRKPFLSRSIRQRTNYSFVEKKEKKDRKIRRKQKKETYDSSQLREQISIVAKISRSTFP